MPDRRPRRLGGLGALSITAPARLNAAMTMVIVPRLRSMGYDVTFREFEGRHELPPDIAIEAMQWMAGPRTRGSPERDCR